MRTVLILLAALALAAGPVAAQEADGSDKAAREALVRRYFTAMEFEKLMDTMLASMIPVLTEQTARSEPALTPEHRQMIGEIVRETMRDVMTPRLIDESVSLYADTFSHAELAALVAFYESAEGRSIMRKTPELVPMTVEISRRLIPEMQQEVMDRLCRRIDCEANAPTKGRPS